MNISVLRTAFDKLGGLNLTQGIRTPKRPFRLPEVLNAAAVRELLRATPSLRDRLLTGLLYGAGLKVGEACALRWTDADVQTGMLTVRFAGGTRRRTVPIPARLLPLLHAGRDRCQSADYVFPGRRQGTHLTGRMAERILKQAVLTAGLPAEITAMTLRHTYAIERLREGMNPRELQERLGHWQLKTTLRYQLLLAPVGVVSPADRLPALNPTPIAAPAPVSVSEVTADPVVTGASVENGSFCVETAQLPFPPPPDSMGELVQALGASIRAGTRRALCVLRRLGSAFSSP